MADKHSSTQRLLETIRGKGKDTPGGNPPGAEKPSSRNSRRSGSRTPGGNGGLTLGIDIGPNSLSMVKIAPVHGRRTLQGYWQVPYESSDVSFDSPEFARFLNAKVTEFCGKTKKINIWTLVSSAKADLWHMRVPKTKGNLWDTVFWTAKKEKNFNDKEFALNFEVLEEVMDKGVPKLQVIAYTVPRKAIDKRVKLFARAGLKLKGVTISPFALQSIFRSNWIPLGESLYANLFIGRNWSRIDVFKEGNLMLSRTIKSGTFSMVETLMEIYNENIDKKKAALARQKENDEQTEGEGLSPNQNQYPGDQDKEPEPEANPETAAQAVPEIVTQDAAEAVPESIPEAVAETLPEMELDFSEAPEPQPAASETHGDELEIILDLPGFEADQANAQVETASPGKDDLEMELDLSELGLTPLPNDSKPSPSAVKTPPADDSEAPDQPEPLWELELDEDEHDDNPATSPDKPAAPSRGKVDGPSLSTAVEPPPTPEDTPPPPPDSIPAGNPDPDPEAETETETETVKDPDVGPDGEDLRPLDFDQASKLLYNKLLGRPLPPGIPGSDMTEDEVYDLIMPAVDRLVRQVERTFDHTAGELGGRGELILFSGDICTNQRLISFMNEQLGMRSVLLDPMEPGLPGLPDIDLPESAGDRLTYNLTIGLALCDDAHTPNLLNTYKDRENAAKSRKATRMVYSVSAILLLVLGLAAWWQNGLLADQKAKLAKAQSQLASRVPRLNESLLTQFATKAAKNLKKARELSSRYEALAVYNEIASLTPGNVKLLSMNVQLGQGLQDSGTDKKNGPGILAVSQGAKVVILDGIVQGSERAYDATLATYLVRLQDSPLFQTPIVHKRDVEDVPGAGKSLRFVLHVNLN